MLYDCRKSPTVHALIICFVVVLSCNTAFGVNVRGYYRKDGTYVRPHTRSAPSGRSTYSVKSNYRTYYRSSPNTGYRTSQPEKVEPLERTAGGAVGRLEASPQAEKYSTSLTRTWIDSAGRYSKEARLLEVTETKATLAATNGAIVEILIEALSQADQDFINSRPFDPTPGRAKSLILSGKVTNVIDGNTVVVDINGKLLNVKLEGIDAPDPKQSGGEIAKISLASLCLNRASKIRIKGKDKSEMLVAGLSVDRVDISKRMLSMGYAWHDSRYNRNKGYAVAEDYARRVKKGIWAKGTPIAPWVWRASKENNAN